MAAGPKPMSSRWIGNRADRRRSARLALAFCAFCCVPQPLPFAGATLTGEAGIARADSKAAERMRQLQERAAERARELQERAAAKIREQQERAAEKAREQQERAAEKAREQQERAAEKAREQQERAAEKAREQQERAAEKAREQQERAAEKAREAAESSRAQAATQSSRPEPEARSEDRSATTQAARSDNSATPSDKSAKGEATARRSERREDDARDAEPPGTISEWLKRFGAAPEEAKRQQPAALPPKAAQPAAKPAGPPGQAPKQPASEKVASPPQQAQPSKAAAPPAAKVQAVQTVPPPRLPDVKVPAASPGVGKAGPAAPRAPLTPFPEMRVAPEILAVNAQPADIARATAMGFTIQQSTTMPRLGLSVVKLMPPPGLDAVSARAALGTRTGSGSYENNRVYRPYRAATGGESAASTATRAPAPAASCGSDRCYATAAIGWQPALRTCTADLRIGIIDTAVDQQHPALREGFASKRYVAQSFLDRDQKQAASGHGTGVLSLLAGSPQSSTPGLVPDARLFAADIFHADGAGEALADTVSLLKALDWMDEKGVRIVNMSVAGPHDGLMEKAIQRLARKGTIFVAAAGNEGPSAPPVYPAAYRDVIAITAVAKDLRSYRRANRGDYIDAAAPGVDVWAAQPGARESYHSGTSFAVPFATAVLASVHAQVATKTKEAMLAAVTYKDLGLPGRDPVYGRGLLLAPPECAPAAQDVAERAPRDKPFGMTPSGVGASGVSFGFAAGKP